MLPEYVESLPRRKAPPCHSSPVFSSSFLATAPLPPALEVSLDRLQQLSRSGLFLCQARQVQDSESHPQQQQQQQQQRFSKRRSGEALIHSSWHALHNNGEASCLPPNGVGSRTLRNNKLFRPQRGRT